MFGICTSAPHYTGKAQPSVLAPSMMGLVDLVSGLLKSPAPAYVGAAQSPPASPVSSFLCSFLSAPQPAYVKAKPWRDEQQRSAPTRTGEGR